MVQTCTAQERTRAALWILAKKKIPFTDFENVKDCMLAIVDEVINEGKMKTSVTSAIKNVPLSDTSDIRRVEIQATNVFKMPLNEVKKDRCAHFLCTLSHFWERCDQNDY